MMKRDLSTFITLRFVHTMFLIELGDREIVLQVVFISAKLPCSAKKYACMCKGAFENQPVGNILKRKREILKINSTKNKLCYMPG